MKHGSALYVFSNGRCMGQFIRWEKLPYKKPHAVRYIPVGGQRETTAPANTVELKSVREMAVMLA